MFRVTFLQAVLLSLLCSTLALAGTGVDLFIRGDANGDGVIDISDPVYNLATLYAGGAPAPCPDAADANDDGTINVADVISCLAMIFDPSVTTLPPPFPFPGVDNSADGLYCGTIPCVQEQTVETDLALLFPLPICVPPQTITGSGATIDVCEGNDCAGSSLGCTLVLDISTINYQTSNHSLTMTGTGVINPMQTRIRYNMPWPIPDIDTTCDTVVSGNVLVSVNFTSVNIMPGVDQITGVGSSDISISNFNINASACGSVINAIIGIVETLIEDTVTDMVATQIEPMLVTMFTDLLLTTDLYICVP